MKIIDPKVENDVYCRDQDGHISLIQEQLSAASRHDLMSDEGVSAGLRKGAFLSALLLTMSHAMEKGAKPVDVASAFFDASFIECTAPDLAAHNDAIAYMPVLGEEAETIAASHTIMNIMLLMKIAHHSLAHGDFSQQEKLKADFGQAIEDKGWPLEFSDEMEPVFDMDLNAENNGDIDQMLRDVQNAHERFIALIENSYEG